MTDKYKDILIKQVINAAFFVSASMLLLYFTGIKAQLNSKVDNSRYEKDQENNEKTHQEIRRENSEIKDWVWFIYKEQYKKANGSYPPNQ